MRSWTLLLIPHDTEEPRSIAVSGRMVRAAALSAAIVALAAVIGIDTVAARWVSAGEMGRSARAASMLEERTLVSGAEIDSLRATVEALYHVLDTIRFSDARLSEAAGLAPGSAPLGGDHATIAVTQATADSLLLGANQLASRLVALADSARGRTAAPDTTVPKIMPDRPVRSGTQH
ncbi:MAG: hypothetical protein ABI910_23615 [Gemmatimonadota bacterium]